MYSLADYGSMIADPHRIGPYSEAIARAVRPGDVVADIGCGPGLFSLLACRAGARRVFAIDMQGIVEFGRELAKINGFADRIQFLEGDSRQVNLPERVRVIVSDIRGVLPFFRDAIPSIEDARQRFLAPGGVMIPQRDTVKVGVIEANEDYARLMLPWKRAVPSLDFSPSLPVVLNGEYSGVFRGEQLLSEPQPWCVLDYMAGTKTNASGELRFRTTRSGTAHGICLWFETQLFEGIGYSTGPGPIKTIYGQMLYPWLKPVPVRPGQEIQVGLHANLVGKDYVWRWETRIPAQDGEPEICFKQSTFHGWTFSAESLRRCAVDYVPALTDEGLAESWMLQAMDGRASLQEIAQSASERFPNVYRRWEDAFRRLVEIADRFSR